MFVSMEQHNSKKGIKKMCQKTRLVILSFSRGKFNGKTVEKFNQIFFIFSGGKFCVFVVCGNF